MKVTLKQIAEKTGVSINTVSLALRGMSTISEGTRQRILEAAHELGYQRKPNKVLPSQKNLCLVSTEVNLQDSYFYMKFQQIFVNYALANGYHMVVFDANYFQGDINTVCANLEASSVAGILTLGDMEEQEFSNIVRCGIPVVAVGARYYHNEVCTFIEDNQLAAYQAVQFLRENGYQNIGFAGSPLHSIAFSERYWGYRQTCQRAGIDCDPEMEWLDLMPANGLEENIRIISTRIRKGCKLPQAFFCAHDMIAIALCKGAAQNGLCVPDDLALIGVDFSPMGQIVSPRLTTVDVCCRRQAETALKRLITFVEQGEYDASRTLIPTVLRVGNSVRRRGMDHL